MMLTLSECARKHSTDKGLGGHNYTPIYERYLRPLRDEKIRLCELGFFLGGSAWMWHDYFPNGDFWFVDNNPKYENVPPRSFLSDCDQADPDGMKQALEGGAFDVIVDDASHINDKTIASFKLWWRALKPGGLYVIEDLHCSYAPAYGGSEDPDSHGTVMGFLKGLSDEANRSAYPAYHRKGFDVAWIHFYRSIVFIKRSGSRGQLH
jgi:hypothetical protein